MDRFVTHCHTVWQHTFARCKGRDKARVGDCNWQPLSTAAVRNYLVTRCQLSFVAANGEVCVRLGSTELHSSHIICAVHEGAMACKYTAHVAGTTCGTQTGSNAALPCRPGQLLGVAGNIPPGGPPLVEKQRNRHSQRSLLLSVEAPEVDLP